MVDGAMQIAEEQESNMPYIKQERRAALLTGYDDRNESPSVAGELNFNITFLINEYFRDHHNYQGINDIIGALEGAKLEFYRRVAAPYEDTKIVENGDVY